MFPVGKTSNWSGDWVYIPLMCGAKPGSWLFCCSFLNPTHVTSNLYTRDIKIHSIIMTAVHLAKWLLILSNFNASLIHSRDKAWEIIHQRRFKLNLSAISETFWHISAAYIWSKSQASLQITDCLSWSQNLPSRSSSAETIWVLSKMSFSAALPVRYLTYLDTVRSHRPASNFLFTLTYIYSAVCPTWTTF